MKRRLVRVGLLVGAVALVARLALCLVWLPPALLDADGGSVMLLDRHGELLREAWRDDRGASRHVPLERVSPWIVQAVLAAEDARFHDHWGVDPRAVARAAIDNLQAGRVVGGGSTITQQVIADACGRADGLWGKALEGLRAMRLETVRSKPWILERYLNGVSFGNNTRGVESASLFYLGRSCGEVSLAQAAFLAAIPRGPDLYDPLRWPGRVQERQRWILGRMAALGMIDEDARARAAAEPLLPTASGTAFLAPHFVEMVMSSMPTDSVEVRTTLDAGVQREVEAITRRQVERLRERGANGGAVVVLDNATGEVIALVGSPDWFDAASDGQVNLAAAPRQPGSALKPFTYSLALEKGMTTATRIDDSAVRYPTRGGVFAPTNYDERFHGRVSMRTALACSYNVPAVRVLHEVGVEALLARLRAVGMTSLRESAEHYGLALTLGDGEITLMELTSAYCALARGGTTVEARLVAETNDAAGNWRDEPTAGSRRVIPARVAFLLTDVLADADARAPAFGRDSVLTLPFPCAVKTGTSRAYRDNWCVGYTTRYTVGVWVGNTRGTPMADVSGVDGAGPIFREVMLALHATSPPRPFRIPEGVEQVTVCVDSGERPSEGCSGTSPEWFLAGTAPQRRCREHAEHSF